MRLVGLSADPVRDRALFSTANRYDSAKGELRFRLHERDGEMELVRLHAFESQHARKYQVHTHLHTCNLRLHTHSDSHTSTSVLSVVLGVPEVIHGNMCMWARHGNHSTKCCTTSQLHLYSRPAVVRWADSKDTFNHMHVLTKAVHWVTPIESLASHRVTYFITRYNTPAWKFTLEFIQHSPCTIVAT